MDERTKYLKSASQELNQYRMEMLIYSQNQKQPNCKRSASRPKTADLTNDLVFEVGESKIHTSQNLLVDIPKSKLA